MIHIKISINYLNLYKIHDIYIFYPLINHSLNILLFIQLSIIFKIKTNQWNLIRKNNKIGKNIYNFFSSLWKYHLMNALNYLMNTLNHLMNGLNHLMNASNLWWAVLGLW